MESVADALLHERELREQSERSHFMFHDAEAKARAIELRGLELRLDSMNSLRQQINCERGRFVIREFYDEQHSSLREDMDTRLKLLETSKSNMEGRIWMMGAAISGIVIVLNVVLHFMQA